MAGRKSKQMSVTIVPPGVLSTLAAAAAADTTTSFITEEEVANLTDDHTHCLVCYSDLVTLRGKTPCDHNDICGVCHLRLRHLHDDKKCPICKTTNATVIVDDKSGGKKFSDYPMWGDEIGSNFTFRQDVGMFFTTHYYQSEILPLFGHTCHTCDFDPAVAIIPAPAATDVKSNNNRQKKPPTPLRALQDHLRATHRLAMCQLCIDHKRDVVARLKRHTLPNKPCRMFCKHPSHRSTMPRPPSKK